MVFVVVGVSVFLTKERSVLEVCFRMGFFDERKECFLGVV